MSLNADEIAGMRSTVSAALPDTCTIKRETAQGAYNHAILQHGAPTVATQYTGACRVRSIIARAYPAQIGERDEVLAHYVATVPFDTASIDVNDFLTVTASPYDTSLVGEEFRILEVELGSWTLGRRLLLEKRQPIL